MMIDSLRAGLFCRTVLPLALLICVESALSYWPPMPWYALLVTQGALFALSVALIVAGLAIELRPLMSIRDGMVDRDPMQLDPIRFADLPAELRPIANTINQCIARLRLDVARRREFVADAAHQLRTPLSLLDLQAQCAARCKHDDPGIAEALDGIRSTSRTMTSIVDQLLLLVKAEEAIGPTARSAVDMADVVTTAIEDLAVTAQRRNVDLGAELVGPMFVSGSENLLMALAKNVIDNAVHHIQEGGRATARCRREAKEVVFEVTDNGPGIAAEERPRVFDCFHRGALRTDGAGLGLTIVHRVAEAHGGSVRLAPGPGNIGLQVTVRLPCRTET